MITGAPAGHQELQLMDRDDKKIGVLAPDDALLGSFPVEDGMRIHVSSIGWLSVAFDGWSGDQHRSVQGRWPV